MFTHNDLDGVSCGILGKVAYKNELIDIENCGYENINEKILNFLNDESVWEDYSFVYITDISVNEAVAERIEKENKQSLMLDGQPAFQLIDHHVTALGLNKYEWAIVDTSDSGTKMLFDYLVKIGMLNDHKYIHAFVNQVNYYDTWRWVELNLTVPKELNDVLKLIGTEEFVKYHVDRLTTIQTITPDCISEEQSKMVEIFAKKNNEYIDYKLSKVEIIETKYGKAGIVICDLQEATSLLGNKICNELDVEFAVIVYDGGIALRSIREFDVSKIAKENGGGGHKNAAGFKFDTIKNISNKLGL
jgi:uncharacterized protein